MKVGKTMTVIVETTSLMEEIVFRDIVRIEDKEEWIVLNDKNGVFTNAKTRH